MSKMEQNLSAIDAAALAHKLATSLLIQPSTQPIPKKPLLKDLLLHQEHKELLKELIQERLDQGVGETLFEIGIDDLKSMDLTEDEFAGVVKYLDQVANELDADTCLLHQRQTKILQTSDKEVETTDKKPFFGHMLIRKRAGEVENLLELRISVVGNVDAGKSTLLGVLTKNTLDDGRGKARLNLFKHKHEIESGRTSSVGLEVMGFDSKATVISGTSIGKQKITWEDVYTHASKVITFLDLAGHEKYLKTTVFGMTGCSPDFVMLMVGANAGIIGMTKEHLGLALALQVPVFIVVTKIDMCPANVLENTISQINKILKSNGCRKMPLFVKNQADVLMSATHFVSERLCPVFQVSNVDGRGLDLLRTFLNLLHSNLRHKYDVNAPVEYMITDTFSVPGVGTVVSGTIASGIVHAGDTLLLGPDSLGQFVPTVVKSIQRKRVNTTAAYAGQSASFALKKVKRSCITKGMVMVSKSMEPKAVMEFEAEVLILYHSTTIGSRYQAMVHCGGVRQTARIVDLDKAVLRTGDRSIVRFRFMQKPEYLKVGARLLFREGRTKGLGKVTRLIYDGELVDK